jgi:hypothetical protein
MAFLDTAKQIAVAKRHRRNSEVIQEIRPTKLESAAFNGIKIEIFGLLRLKSALLCLDTSKLEENGIEIIIETKSMRSVCWQNETRVENHAGMLHPSLVRFFTMGFGAIANKFNSSLRR